MVGILAERKFLEKSPQDSFAGEILPNWSLDEAVPA
jgi:hypothetical protein